MNHELDQDSKQILTEEEKREVFIGTICQDCITNEDGLCERDCLECWLVQLALEHYDAWGGYNSHGYISCPPCPKCKTVAPSEPAYTEDVGWLLCTACGHMWYELPHE